MVTLSLLLTLSCYNNDNSKTLIDDREVDFLNKTGDVMEGKLVRSDILGADNMVIFDTLFMVATNNPEGQLQVFSLNTLEHLGSFCKKGRARNEMLNAMAFTEQAYYKNGHLILAMFDPPRIFKEVDITASLQSGNTEIISSQEFTSMAGGGEFMLLDNDYNYRYEYERNIFELEEVTGIPTRYTVYKDGEKRELKFFGTLMDTESKNKTLPYLGSLYKHPQKNIVVQSFQNMDYLLFMDFDAEKYFTIHQKGSVTFNDTYVHSNSQRPIHFSDGASSSKYLMILYRQGEYTQKTTEGEWYPELLVFDWDGNYITGFKMDREIYTIEYDEIHKILYGLNHVNEEFYAYDMATFQP